VNLLKVALLRPVVFGDSSLVSSSGFSSIISHYLGIIRIGGVIFADIGVAFISIPEACISFVSWLPALSLFWVGEAVGLASGISFGASLEFLSIFGLANLPGAFGTEGSAFFSRSGGDGGFGLGSSDKSNDSGGSHV